MAALRDGTTECLSDERCKETHAKDLLVGGKAQHVSSLTRTGKG